MTRRARAIAVDLRRQPEPSPWLPWVILAFLLLASVTAQGQTRTEKVPQPSAPVPTAPVPSGRGGVSGGVLTPTAPVDPGIHAPAPAPNMFPMPVVKPPGTPGGNQTVIPR